jgi:uncharacterized protein YndB with AHSA1/START domain
MTTESRIMQGDTTDREIVLSRVFDAPRERVWEAMTHPEQVVNWWGPRGFTTTIEVMDLRPGGVWKHVMHGPDGTDFPNKSIFTEVVKPERIVYRHSGSREGAPGVQFVATWSIEVVEAGKTRLTLRQVFETPEARDTIVKEYGAVEGGKQTFARLGEFLAPGSVIVERLLDAPVDVVWRAITELDQMKQWYFPTIPAFKTEIGFETQVDTEHEGKIYEHLWKVTEVVPGRKITYSWKYKGITGDSVVSWELFPEGPRTRLCLVHTGLASFQAIGQPGFERSSFFGGWTFFARRLTEYLKKVATKS